MRKLHRLLGLFLFLPLLSFAVTGSAAAIARYLREESTPYRVQGQSAPTGVRTEESVSRVFSTPGLEDRLSQFRGIRFAEPGSDSTDQILFAGGETWFLSPDTSEVLLRQLPSGSDLVSFLHQIHRGKVFGTPGRVIFTILGVLLIAMALAGLGLQRVRHLSRYKPGNRRNHHVLGLVLALPLLVILTTGSVWNFSEELRGQRVLSAVALPSLQDFATAYVQATDAYGPTPAEGIYRVSGKTLVLFRDAGRVYIDDRSVEVFRPWSARGWIELCYLLHTGALWGQAGIALTLLFGLLVIGLVVTGVPLVMKRKRIPLE